MNRAELDQRVLEIARKGLAGIPAGFQDFERLYMGGGFDGTMLRFRLSTLLATSQIAIALGHYGTLDRDILAFVDQWAAENPNMHIEPLLSQHSPAIPVSTRARPATVRAKRSAPSKSGKTKKPEKEPFACKRNPDDLAKAIVDAGNCLYAHFNRLPTPVEVFQHLGENAPAYGLEYDSENKKLTFTTNTGESGAAQDNVRKRYLRYIKSEFAIN